MLRLLHNRLEAIQRLKPLTTIIGCRSFAGIVNILSIFCPDLQKLLKSIYDLTRKDRHFIWGQEQQKAFDEIKCRLQKPPVLHLPDGKGRFYLYSDTHEHAMGSALYQIQNSKPKLILYASKRLPIASKNYSITELEIGCLAINITSFVHLLKKVDSFNLYYMEGKNIILSDFLSRQRMDDSNPHEIIPISFDMQAILKDRYYNVQKDIRYLTQAWSQAKASGNKLPEVHRIHKDVDLNVKPEKQILKPPNLATKPNPQNKPRLGQGRVGLRRK